MSTTNSDQGQNSEMPGESSSQSNCYDWDPTHITRTLPRTHSMHPDNNQNSETPHESSFQASGDPNTSDHNPAAPITNSDQGQGSGMYHGNSSQPPLYPNSIDANSPGAVPIVNYGQGQNLGVLHGSSLQSPVFQGNFEHNTQTVTPAPNLYQGQGLGMFYGNLSQPPLYRNGLDHGSPTAVPPANYGQGQNSGIFHSSSSQYSMFQGSLVHNPQPVMPGINFDQGQGSGILSNLNSPFQPLDPSNLDHNALATTPAMTPATTPVMNSDQGQSLAESPAMSTTDSDQDQSSKKSSKAIIFPPHLLVRESWPLYDPNPETFNYKLIIEHPDLRFCQLSDYATIALQVLWKAKYFTRDKLVAFRTTFDTKGRIRVDHKHQGEPALAPDGTVMQAQVGYGFLIRTFNGGKKLPVREIPWTPETVKNCKEYNQWLKKFVNELGNSGPYPGAAEVQRMKKDVKDNGWV